MIEIKKQRNALRIEVWRFIIIRETLFLDRYFIAEKESTRHRKYNDVVRYDRVMTRGNSIEESEIPLTNEIKNEALNMYFDTINCKKWSDR